MKIDKPREKTIFDISEINPHLYLAGYGCITEAKLKQFGITHAVDCTNLPNKKIEGIQYLEVNIDDSLIAKIEPHFEKVSSFVNEAKNSGGKTIVFCAAGVSRSASLAIMCLVIGEGKTLKEAYHAVNQVRPIVSPNINFWRQMIHYERTNKGEATVTLITGRTARPVPDVYLHRTLVYN